MHLLCWLVLGCLYQSYGDENDSYERLSLIKYLFYERRLRFLDGNMYIFHTELT